MPLFVYLIFYALLALAYIATIHRLPYKGDFLIKSAPILLLSILALLLSQGEAGLLLFGALLLSAGGDISLSFRGEKAFVIGLGMFLLAHVVYIFIFLISFQIENISIGAALLLVSFAVGMLAFLWPRLGNMRIPVSVYIAVILAMGLAATGTGFTGRSWLVVGAIVFMLSDAMIAVDRFLRPVSGAKYFIMTTYYLAQVLIWIGLVMM